MSEEIKTSASFSAEAAPDDAQATQTLADVQSNTATFNELLDRLQAQSVTYGRLSAFYEQLPTYGGPDKESLAMQSKGDEINVTRAALAAKLETIDQIVNTLARRVGTHQRNYKDAREFMQRMVSATPETTASDDAGRYVIYVHMHMVDFLENH